MTLSLDAAYRSFGGEVEASSTPTICRLPDSRRHQLWAIAPRPLASVPMAAVMTMAPVVTMSRPPPAVARVGISAPVVLAICVRIELGALARISNDVLRRRRAGKCG